MMVFINIRSYKLSIQFPNNLPKIIYIIPAICKTHNDKDVYSEYLIRLYLESLSAKIPHVHAAGINPNKYPNSGVKI